MRKVTWRRFNQSAKQLVVGQTTRKYDDPRLNMSHSGYALVWHVQPRVVIFPCRTHYRPSSVNCRTIYMSTRGVMYNSTCRLTKYELLRWLVETPSRDFAHYSFDPNYWPIGGVWLIAAFERMIVTVSVEADCQLTGKNPIRRHGHVQQLHKHTHTHKHISYQVVTHGLKLTLTLLRYPPFYSHYTLLRCCLDWWTEQIRKSAYTFKWAVLVEVLSQQVCLRPK